MQGLQKYLGYYVSLTSTEMRRYEGTLCGLTEKYEQLILQDVQCFGTEERPARLKLERTPGRISNVTFLSRHLTQLLIHTDDRFSLLTDSTIIETSSKVLEIFPTESDIVCLRQLGERKSQLGKEKTGMSSSASYIDLKEAIELLSTKAKLGSVIVVSTDRCPRWEGSFQSLDVSSCVLFLSSVRAVNYHKSSLHDTDVAPEFSEHGFRLEILKMLHIVEFQSGELSSDPAVVVNESARVKHAVSLSTILSGKST